MTPLDLSIYWMMLVPVFGTVLRALRIEKRILAQLESRHGTMRLELSYWFNSRLSDKKFKQYMKGRGAEDPELQALAKSYRKWKSIGYLLGATVTIVAWIRIWTILGEALSL